MLQEMTGNMILGTMMLLMGDLFTILAVALAALACFTAILGKISSKLRQRREVLRFALGTVFLHILLIAMYVGKMNTPDMAGLPNGAFWAFSDLTTVLLMGFSMVLLVITAVVSFSGHNTSSQRVKA